jgi:hypothetical protein
VWRGEKPVQRQGCQVALHCGKCPITRILANMIREDDDPYHSAEPKQGALRPEILAYIGPILVTDEMIKRFDCTPAETARLIAGNDAARAFSTANHKAKGKTKYVPIAKPASAAVMEDVKPQAETDYELNAAVKDAMSGNMAAAVTAGVTQTLAGASKAAPSAIGHPSVPQTHQRASLSKIKQG